MEKELKHIGSVLRKDDIDYKELSDTIKQYRDLVYQASKIDVESNPRGTDIHFENGMALGTNWAAMCLGDIMRTKMFVKGLFEAVEEHRLNNTGTTNILYAGTGPFATLILPILASYSPSEVNCTLMEINTESFSHVKDMIGACGFSDHVTSFVQADASKVVLENPKKIDIMISETMQRALDREQQVPIVMNLLSQLRDDVILIPEKIDVIACLANMNHLDRSEDESDYCERLGSVIELSKAALKDKPYDLKGDNEIHFHEKRFNLNKDTISRFNQLALMTEIQVFGDTWLRQYESGLTTHKLLKDISKETVTDIEYRMQYIVNNDPEIVYSEVK